MRVGVFVNALKAEVLRAIGECGLNLLQFHGDEPPDYCSQFGLMSMKAFRMRDAGTLKELTKYQTNAWLLDAYSPEAVGGTGEKFNWDLAVEAQKFGKPIFLAGGLTPENVAEAVRKVRPFGVDVSSGVEISPGKKEPRESARVHQCRQSRPLKKAGENAGHRNADAVLMQKRAIFEFPPARVLIHCAPRFLKR